MDGTSAAGPGAEAALLAPLWDSLHQGIGALQTQLTALSGTLATEPHDGFDPKQITACQATLATAAAGGDGAATLEALTKTATALGQLGQDIKQLKAPFEPSRWVPVISFLCTALRYTLALTSIALMITAEVCLGGWAGFAANLLGQCGVMGFAAGLSVVEFREHERREHQRQMREKLEPMEHTYNDVIALLHRLKGAQTVAEIRAELSEPARKFFDGLLQAADAQPNEEMINAALRSNPTEEDEKRILMRAIQDGGLRFRPEVAEQGVTHLRAALEQEAARARRNRLNGLAAPEQEPASDTDSVITAPVASVKRGASRGAVTPPIKSPEEALAWRDTAIPEYELRSTWNKVLGGLERRPDIAALPSFGDAHASSTPLQRPPPCGAATWDEANPQQARLPPGIVPA
ncbi:hypothetical protein MB84_29255 (plasmid) [Pandoraea oxalativorans]|uniref:Uncharacterized protein n=1 Tax=Pandoraea oxalativorans TaxID=573737 RepID=A0A0G3IIC2_9BURK|nr:hypothetical protein MB84_29255 [Pandoraea oxalativorans]